MPLIEYNDISQAKVIAIWKAEEIMKNKNLTNLKHRILHNQINANKGLQKMMYKINAITP